MAQSPPVPPSPINDEKARREVRLAHALRANLRKRKAAPAPKPAPVAED